MTNYVKKSHCVLQHDQATMIVSLHLCQVGTPKSLKLYSVPISVLVKLNLPQTISYTVHNSLCSLFKCVSINVGMIKLLNQWSYQKVLPLNKDFHKSQKMGICLKLKVVRKAKPSQISKNVGSD